MARISVAGTLSFQPLTTYPDGTNDFAVVVADLNGDENRDLAVLNFRDNTISILLGNGNGTFQPATMMAGDTNSFSIATADFNDDRRADLVITGSSGVTVLLGNGDGTFQPPHSYPAGSSVSAVHVADFNADGKLDLAVTNANGVGVLLGNGDGTFQPDIDYAVGTGRSTTLVVADFNRDNKTDLVAGTSAGLVILLGNGDGTLQSASSLGVLKYVRDVADFNHDGKPDLIVDNGVGGLCKKQFCGGPMGVMIGNGDGTFQAPVVLDTKAITFSGFAADLDGDGNADLGVVDGLTVRIFLGDGKGGFATPQEFVLRAKNGVVGSAAAIDLNGDQAPDIIAPNSMGNVGILLNSTGSDFSISASRLNPDNIRPGQSANSSVTLKLLNSYHSSVALTCSVQPAQADAPTCSLSSNSVTFDDSGTATATLAIDEGSGTASLNSFQSLGKGGFWWLPVAGFAFLGTTAGLSRKRGRVAFLVATSVFAALVAQLACGGGSAEVTTTTNYTIAVTGTSGATQHSTTVTINVQ
jgi:hypothetical protein